MQLTQKQLEKIKKQYRLSPRETQIVDLILQGIESNAEIAKRIGISTGTSKQYAHVLFAKVQAESKLDLAMKIVDSIQK